MACVAVASLLRTIELEFLQSHPRPLVLDYGLISPNKDLIQSFHQNLGFLISQLDEERIGGVEAVKHLETKLRDLTFRVEDQIEILVAHLYGGGDDDDEYLVGIADLFVEEEDLYVEKPQRDTDAEKTTQPCVKLGQVFQTAMEEIEAITESLVQSFHQKLGFLISQLDEERINGVEAVKHLETKLRDLAFRVRDLAFRVEDEIEFLDAHLYDIEELVLKEEKPQRDTDAEKATQPCVKLGQVFQTAMEEIEAIKEELLKIKNRDEVEERKTAHDVLQRSEVVSSQAQMVGKNDEFEIIKKLLTELGSKEKKVVSIIGMGGIGKTTLARQVYEDPSISIHFDVRAWVVASQLHNKRQILIGLLNSISRQGSLEESTDEDLALKLYQCLKRQRYMVVVDDVWSGEAWDDVSNCFPEDGNGSRVLLTTRLAEVANYSSSDSDFSHHMQLLDQSDSWNLFCEKSGKFCGVEFEIIGRSIVEKCKGLPLAIIVVAGLFSKLSTLNEWENIAKVLDSSTTTTIAAICSKILLLSYNHLPHHLKACFLYLGVFPEDYAINANQLARLWSAEGLVNTSENENFDVVADRHIHELMDRNLILVRKWSCCGRKIKVFGVHDLLHAFCVKEAQKENLLHVVRENGSDFPQRYFRWVSIQSSNFDVSTLCYSSRSCRSFFCFSHNDINLNWEQFKLVRVFFFPRCSKYKNIVDFVHLRYFSRPSYDNIGKLFKTWNLQTLSIKGEIDEDFLKFPQLQYFACLSLYGQSPIFVHKSVKSLSRWKPEHCTKQFVTHQNLQSLSPLNIGHCTKLFFRHFPNVKKIWIVRGNKRDSNDCIENLVNLQQLERLHISANYWDNKIVQINGHITLLKCLKRLRFEGNHFEWNGINVLCKLPRLEVLKLNGGSCVGKQWELLEDDKFCQLIFLRIGSTDLKDWKATGDHFPKLEHLSLFSCKKLKEIPSGFAEISKLKSIQLADCRPSVVSSAEEIKEEQLDYLNNIVDVVVTERRRYSAYTQVSKPEYDEYESDEA